VNEGWIVDNPMSARYPIYTRGNVGEVFPDPVAPLSWTLSGRPHAEHGWRDALLEFGAFDRDEFDPAEIEILGVFGGYCYLNVSISRIFGVRTPGLTPELIDYTLFGEQSEAWPYEPQITDESLEHTARIAETLGRVLSVTELPELRDDQRAMAELRASRPDPSTLSDRDLVERTRELVNRWFRPLFARHLSVTYAATVGTGIVTTVAGNLGDPTLAMRLLSGIGDVDSAAPSWAMWELGRAAAASDELSRHFDKGIADLDERLRSAASGSPEVASFVESFDRFIFRHGSRGPNEWEMRCPSWETNPELALTAIDRMRLSPEEAAPQSHHERMAADRQRLAAEVTETLAGDPEAQAQFQAGLASALVYMPGRERSKTTVIRLTNELRVMMHELGRRMVEAGHFRAISDFSMLLAEELDDFVLHPEAFRTALQERESRYQELAALVPPFVLNGNLVPQSQWASRAGQLVEVAGPGTSLTGIPGCPGDATGRACVVLDPSGGEALQPGDVLVAPITDPSWTPLFVPAAGVVVDVGAQMSHAVIVSRELGIPCVVSVTGATRKIRNGATVRVNGTKGEVTVLD
jgi:rifampicin phosphotransferase